MYTQMPIYIYIHVKIGSSIHTYVYIYIRSSLHKYIFMYVLRVYLYGGLHGVDCLHGRPAGEWGWLCGIRGWEADGWQIRACARAPPNPPRLVQGWQIRACARALGGRFGACLGRDRIRHLFVYTCFPSCGKGGKFGRARAMRRIRHVWPRGGKFGLVARARRIRHPLAWMRDEVAEAFFQCFPPWVVQVVHVRASVPFVPVHGGGLVQEQGERAAEDAEAGLGWFGSPCAQSKAGCR